ncbi:MAG: glycosyltransferase family 2 protein [Flavobacteriales bacterium]|nr:glycosyltransferase family 2 protein [Flavobacteriales bacterium]MCB9198489.1 glycosyltransferase family 2 protein [Flavobacteriales bacterium]
MIQISAAIITFNEERNIERCIRSLEGIADEVIVVDSLSTDKTVEIAISLGAQVIEQKFLGHIEQKNLAIEKCSFQYVISLDADEAISEELKKSILEVKNNWQGEGYSFNRLTNYCGKWIKTCGWYPDTKLRLFEKGKGKWQGINPHDEFRLFNSSPIHLKGDLLHYSFYTIDQHKKQIEYFSSIGAKALFNKGVKSSWIKLIINPISMFVKSYFIKGGILDGKYGFIISWYSAGEKYKKYKKLRQLRG